MLVPATTLAHHYTIIRLLGQGGCGAVYLARDERLRREVAIKQTLYPDDARFVAQLEAEAELLANVDHPTLPRVYHSFVEQGGHYLVMQYIPGASLAEQLPRQPGGRFALAAVRNLLPPLLDALGYLHSRVPPIVHRDLKPGNVRLTPDGRVYLVDFGIAKTYQPDTRTDTLARAVTAGFSSFEQYGGGPTDARSDLYSLDALLYWMLTGAIPPEAPQRVKHDPLTPLTQLVAAVPPPLATAIQRLLAVWPDDRYPSLAALQAELETTLAPAESQPGPVGQLPTGRSLREKPADFAAASTSTGPDHAAQLARLQPDVIVRGPMFNERVQLIELKQVGTLYRLRGEGLDSGVVHRPMLREEQLHDLIIEETGRFMATRCASAWASRHCASAWPTSTTASSRCRSRALTRCPTSSRPSTITFSSSRAFASCLPTTPAPVRRSWPAS